MPRADPSRDPWAMYYVVRNDRRLSFAQAMATTSRASEPRQRP